MNFNFECHYRHLLVWVLFTQGNVRTSELVAERLQKKLQIEGSIPAADSSGIHTPRAMWIRIPEFFFFFFLNMYTFFPPWITDSRLSLSARVSFSELHTPRPKPHLLPSDLWITISTLTRLLPTLVNIIGWTPPPLSELWTWKNRH